ncbi:MAG: glycosyltransferase family 4 protein [Deltaproteobacteria bacterium]|nr:glycosyltransferase family 4 protein [Deltaproteobacteria bacterium]
MKIAVLISSLRCGGTERTVSLLANAWTECGHAVEIITLSAKDVAPFFPLDARIQHRALDLQFSSATKIHGLFNNLRRIRIIRSAFQQSKPDIIVAFMEGTTALAVLAARGLRTPVMLSEVAVPAVQSGSWFWNQVRKIIYPHSAGLIVPSRGVQNYFVEELHLPCEVIPNPVAVPARRRESTTDGQKLIAVGRLSPEKGFDLLLRAFVRIHAAHPQTTLSIFGEGPLHDELIRLRDSLGLQDFVHFPGTSKDLAQELAKADIFVLSSKYEGFGNVLCEAMAVGLPVVSFDCPTGPREIIRHGIDGVLVEPDNVEKLAAAVGDLLSNRKLRSELSERAPEILQRLGLPRISAEWQVRLARACGQTGDASDAGPMNTRAVL